MSKELPFVLETDMERDIVSRPEFQAGLWYGKPRRGHPEGAVAYHIRDVLANVDKLGREPERRAQLRIITLVHDTFKYAVDPSKPKSGDNHHGMLARRFLDPFYDHELLKRQFSPPAEAPLVSAVPLVVETHDEAFNAWASMSNWGAPETKAVARAKRLLERLRGHVDLYLDFFECDNGTEGKTQEPFHWFSKLAREEAKP